ncbi:serine/threonine-protein kinase [Streptomyces sp. H10-C2]|uniref:serine/threonine-protein kinase n=1 Tax=unclassified Streptomyces TaxID=2593676 RepID=UPI0024BB05A9|nr:MULTISPECIES: serine/threonine-protein kinase [unclassified Streptomyces]MDJ0345722.1 serine/threonine-protein kinase [Streptomyces sp. PH10-H1]MDJ0374585.1 serine/threonine-protein kinase [Streptomyces sp. H10-C2]
MSDITSNDSGSGLSALRPEDPREVAGYRLIARIGEGGLGSVYLSHTRGGQPVALKVIRREYARDEEFRRRFQQEVRSARQVRGYHLVPVVDHDTAGSEPWLATAYVPGLPLDDALVSFGPLPLPAALQLVGCAAEGLRAVHAAGVIHRDLKPGSILLADDGPWVIGFGIARAADSTHLTRSGGLIGTPQYMSPEHANGHSLTPATDIFSLGLLAAVVATGRHPYGDGGAITVATQIANTAIRPPDLTGYPERLRPLLERCLAADPAGRPSPAELAGMCERAAGRPLRDFNGWLPAPVAAEITRREAAAQRPPEPEPVAAPAAAPPPARPSYPANAPEQWPRAVWSNWGTGTPDTPPVGGRYRQQTLLAIAGSVVALVLAVTLTYAFLRDDGSAATATAPPPGYRTLFQDRPMTLRPVDSSHDTRVDLDLPVVDPMAHLDLSDIEISYGYGAMTFHTPMGRSSGLSPEACRAAAETHPFPGTMEWKSLRDSVAEGDLLCTLTRAHHLAMMRITGITPGRTAAQAPTWTVRVTLWQLT